MRSKEIDLLLVLSLALTGVLALKLFLDEVTTLVVLFLECFKKLNEKFKEVKPPPQGKEVK